MLTKQKISTSLEKRFWESVLKTETCWGWTKSKTKAGYGKISDGQKTLLAHRISYILNKGEIPNDLQIDHLCRNRWCVNPDYLEIVTQARNIQRGLLAKLNFNKVIKIREMYKTGGFSYRKLGTIFNVSNQNISKIINNQSWKI